MCILMNFIYIHHYFKIIPLYQIYHQNYILFHAFFYFLQFNDYYIRLIIQLFLLYHPFILNYLLYKIFYF